MNLSASNHLLAKLPGPRLAFALLTENAKRAVVFVHGFFGNASTTWHHFQILIDELSDAFPWWKECDAYFYSYRSWEQVVPQAQDLASFLEKNVLCDQATAPQIEYSFVLKSGFTVQSSLRFQRKYKQLILAGHSTGAVIIRQAVLDELENILQHHTNAASRDRFIKRSKLLNASLRFFAPAHLGAICAGGLGVAQNAPVSETLLSMKLRSTPLYQNIAPGSPVLETLRARTEKLQCSYGAIAALRATSLFGKQDSIVNVGKYEGDFRTETEMGHSHTSICKPNLKYTEPLRFLTDVPKFRAAGK